MIGARAPHHMHKLHHIIGYAHTRRGSGLGSGKLEIMKRPAISCSRQRPAAAPATTEEHRKLARLGDKQSDSDKQRVTAIAFDPAEGDHSCTLYGFDIHKKLFGRYKEIVPCKVQRGGNWYHQGTN